MALPISISSVTSGLVQDLSAVVTHTWAVYVIQRGLTCLSDASDFVSFYRWNSSHCRRGDL